KTAAAAHVAAALENCRYWAERALEAANKFPNAGEKANALCSTVWAYASLGDFDKARQIRNTIKPPPNEYQRENADKYIAMETASSGNFSTASGIVRNIPDVGIRKMAWASI